MKRYWVTVEVTGEAVAVVEADSDDDAYELAVQADWDSLTVRAVDPLYIDRWEDSPA